MKYFGAHVGTQGYYPNALKCAIEHGMTAIQIELGDLTKGTVRNPDQKETTEYLNLLHENDIKVFVHMPYILNTANPTKPGWVKKIFSDWIGVADKLECSGIVWHPGSHKEATMEQGVENFQKFIEYLLPKTEMLLLPENTAGSGTAIANDLPRLFDMIEMFPVDRVKITFDSCHAWASGFDLASLAERTWLHAREDRIGLVHANNSEAPFGSHRDKHASIAQDSTIPSDLLKQVYGILSSIPHVLERNQLNLDELEILKSL